MISKLRIFIVYHDKIFHENYTKDTLFDLNLYTFLKVGDNEKHDDSFHVHIKQLETYIPLGKHYAEAEAIYNIYKNPEMYENLDFIGFSQYDKPHQFRNKDGFNVTEEILNNLAPNTHISLESYLFEVDLAQQIMMDEAYPNQLTGYGRNAYVGILTEYNQFFKTHYSFDDLMGKEINLCSSYILPVANWLNVMKFISEVIESKRLDKFDTERKYRLQGGLLERYFGVAIMLEGLKSINLTIEHISQK